MSVYYTYHCTLCDKKAPLLTKGTPLPLENFQASNFTRANKVAFLIRDCDEYTFEEMLYFVDKHKAHTVNGNRALKVVNEEGVPINS